MGRAAPRSSHIASETAGSLLPGEPNWGDFPRHFVPSPAYHLANGTWPMHALWEAELAVGDSLAGPAAARQEVRAQLIPLLTGAELDDTLLLLSELLTNAVRHGGGARAGVSMRLAVAAACVRGEIADGGRGFETASVAGPRDDGGYGLMIVDGAASRWGASRTDGHCVWFEIDRIAHAA